MAEFGSKEFNRILRNEDAAIEWCREVGLVPKEIVCPLCGTDVPITPHTRFGRFLCRRQEAGHQDWGPFRMTATNNTFLHELRMPASRALRLIYAFSKKYTYDATVIACRDRNLPDISRATIADWFTHLRKICMITLDRKCKQYRKIGGLGHVVEVEKCIIGEEKSTRVGSVKGSWIVGMIDRNTKYVRLEICPESWRDANSLLSLIHRHMKKNTTISTVCWKEYEDLDEQRFRQMLAAHSVHLIDPLTEIKTKDDDFCNVRWQRAAAGETHMISPAFRLSEYLWMKDVERRKANPFLQLIEDIKVLYPGGLTDSPEDSDNQ